jgi:hypothetical protein
MVEAPQGRDRLLVDDGTHRSAALGSHGGLLAMKFDLRIISLGAGITQSYLKRRVVGTN